MGYLERNSETLKTPGFSGFDSRVSGFSRVVIFGFGSGSGSKKVGLFARVSGFRVQIPITISVRLWWISHWRRSFVITVVSISFGNVQMSKKGRNFVWYWWNWLNNTTIK